jgi:hypothetical protein
MQIAAKCGNNSVDIFLGYLKFIVFKNFSSRGLNMFGIKDADVHSHFGWIHVPRVELPLLIHVLIVYLLSLLLEGKWNLFFLFFYFRFRGELLHCPLFGGLSLLLFGGLQKLIFGRFSQFLLIFAEEGKDMLV